MLEAVFPITDAHQHQIIKLFNLAIDPLCVIGLDGYFKIVNPALRNLLGYSESELLNKKYIEFIHPEDVEHTVRETQKMLESSSQVLGFTNRYKKRDGDYVTLLWNGNVDWESEAVYCTLQDITQQRKEKEAQRLLVKNFNLIVKGIDAGIWTYDVKKKELWYSDKLFSLMGFEPQVFSPSYQTFYRNIHPQDIPKFKTAFQDHIKYQKRYKIELRLLCECGKYKWVECSGDSIWDHRGKPSKMAGSVIDINKRKESQIARENDKFLLKQSTEMAKVGGWELSVDPLKLIWSEEVYRIHEVDSDFVLSLENAIDFYCKESKPIISQAVEEALNKGVGYDLELKIKTAKERIIWVRAICLPILDDTGKVIGLRGVFQDVNEQKRRELFLNKSIEIISEQNNRFSNFAYIVSHNLRSHTSNFQLLMELQDNTEDPDELKRITEMERTTFIRLQETIEHLTEVVEIQTEITSQKTELDLATVLGHTLDVLAMDISRTQMNIYSDFRALPRINYVKAYLESILLNLVSNSIRYRHPDRQLHIQISSYLENGFPILSVKDNGLGMDLTKNKEKLFGMYKTFHEHPKSKGIGLFITKTQVEVLGGFIEVESEVNVGTCFKIYLEGK